MPILRGNNVINVKVSLKNKELVGKSTYIQNLNESEIVIGDKKFSDSIFSKENDNTKSIMSFIRHHSINVGNNTFTVSTREEKESNLYDVYSIDLPPKYVSAGLDELFSSAVLDLKRTIPNSIKGRNISLKQLGVLKELDSDRIKELKNFSFKNGDEKFEDLIDTLNFIKLFDFEIINKSVVNKEIIEYFIKTQEKTNTDFYKQLKKYYKIATENQEIYNKLSYINIAIYDKPLGLIHISNKDKEKIKNRGRKYDNTL